MAVTVNPLIQQLDRNIYGSFIQENKEAYIKSLKNALDYFRICEQGGISCASKINELIEEISRLEGK